MEQPRFHDFLHRQIPVMILLSIFPGLGYILLGWLHNVHRPALVWYGLIVLMSAWGWRIYRRFAPERMSRAALAAWYRQLLLFFYLFFALWTVIFLIYLREEASKLHYIAIFTQIGASTVASALLYPDRRLFRPIIPLMILPLAAYFALIGAWYGYVLTLFALTLGWVLYYAAASSHQLLVRTHHHASHDQLTGLYNRHHFMQTLQRTLNSLGEEGRYSYLLLIDLDHFKTVNDSLGHDIGDALLIEVARRMEDDLTEESTIARLGGDEFIVIGEESDHEEECRQQAQIVANLLLHQLKQTYQVGSHHIYISASIGIRLLAPQAGSAAEVIREADIAMYEAKAAGRNEVILFNEAISRQVENHLEIERLLHFAAEEGEIRLKFQPQFDKERRVVGAETLVRWHNAQLGDIPPATFITIAEHTGLIVELGEYILESALRTLRDWSQQGIALEQFSVNISVRQLLHHDFPRLVEHLYNRYLDEQLGATVIFEITETVVAEEVRAVVSTMNRLRQLGIRFSMDDFGTGYSSLSYIKELPIDELKIDRAFVSNLDTDDSDQAMVITILSIARFFGLSVVAEGVESQAQFERLRDYRCPLFQGYHLSPPLSAEEFEQLYRAQGEERPPVRSQP